MDKGASRPFASDKRRARARRVEHGSRYSAFGLLLNGFHPGRWRRVWDRPELRDSYDVAIVGGGVHGLSTAYHLASRYGISNVAVFERAYLGGGSSGRNTAIIRSNYLSPESVSFYERSRRLYDRLSSELNFNVLFEPRGHLTLGHDDGALRTLRWRAEANRALGVRAALLDPAECRRLVPLLDVSPDARQPVLGGLWQPPGGIIRHDAVVWAYARAARALGVHIHEHTTVRDVDVHGDRVAAVVTDRGRVETRVVVNCAAGWASTIAAMVGLALPISTVPLQAAVSEPLRALLDPVVASANLHVYVSQTTRGELVFGAAVDPYPSYSVRGSLEFLETTAAHVLELMPALASVRILRQWAGICDLTPDASPIIGRSPIDGFLLDVGWGTYGFKAGPAAGEAVASLIADGRVPDLIRPFSLDRFTTGRLVNEKGAAVVGH